MIGLSIPILLSINLILLLWLLIYSRLNWLVRLGTITISLLLTVVVWMNIQLLAGWPTNDPLPEVYQYHFAHVIEPGSKSVNGVIYLTATDINGDNLNNQAVLGRGIDFGEPRTHRLPYSRKTHEQAQRLNEKSAKGEMVLMKANKNGKGKGEKKGKGGGAGRDGVPGNGDGGGDLNSDEGKQGEAGDGVPSSSTEAGDGIRERGTFGYELPPIQLEPKE